MRFFRRTLVGLFLLSVTIGLMAAAGATVWQSLEARWAEEPSSRPARERIFSANVVTIVPETLRPELTTFGEVRSRRELELRAASAGKIVWLADAFEEGGEVQAGQLLARIDPQNAQSALDTARADLSEAEADLRDAERALGLADDDIAAAEDQQRLRAQALERQLDLQERGVGSQAAVETAELAKSSALQAVVSRRQAKANAEARVDQARTALERRQIALAEAERRLSDTEITAPFAGVLAEVQVVEGGLVANNERLADIIDPTALEVAVRVSTPQYARLLSEQGTLTDVAVTVAIEILGVDLEAEGRITRESAAVGEGQTGRLLFAALGGAPRFRPGDFVTVQIQEPPLERVARLPSGAVNASNRVLVLGEEDRLSEAEVTLLRREGNDVIVRARGLAGREVVASRSPLLGAGIKIRPLRSGEASEPADAPETVALDPDRRARLVAFVEGNTRMPAEAKARVLAQLQEPEVPLRVVERIESRM